MKFSISFLLSLLLTWQVSLPALAQETAAKELTWTFNGTEQLSTGSPRLVLKNGNTMLVLNRGGMIEAGPGSPYGLYENDTRFLSRWQVLLNGKEPTLLSTLTQQGFEGSFLYSILDDVLIERDVTLIDGMNEQIKIRSFVDRPLNFKVTILHNCDFKDMFEVRGIKRVQFGELLPPQLANTRDQLITNTASYRGVDKQIRSTYLTAEDPKPSLNEKGRLEFDISLAPRQSATIELRVDTSNTPEKLRYHIKYSDAKTAVENSFLEWRKKSPIFKSNWVLLDDMVAQSFLDLYVLRQNTPNGPCLGAGLPWYSCAFGRDQCVTALQTMPFMPDLSRDVLKVLAAYQGKTHDSVTEEEPGRIMHELRLGDMALSKEIAFRPYYGTVDATPLWLMLLARYVEATGDLDFARALWPNAESALAYLEKNSSNTNGFLYYGGKNGAALSNQGWKDSGDSIMHKDGKLATAPIAVCEVQGYLYEAYSGSARLAAKLGHSDQASKLNDKARLLKENFRKSFWLPDEHLVAMALDATTKPCDVVGSNAGHLLSTGILDEEMANAVSDRLMKDDMFSGWGIRTLSTGEVRYNPISYHDGSIWPHDNSMIVEGLAARGKMQSACTVLESLIKSSSHAPDARLPELFCGFPRNEFPTTVPYAVSCVPQAWAAGSALQMLKSVLGISLIDNKIHVRHPALPESINNLMLSGLHSGGSTGDLLFERKGNAISVTSTSNEIIIEN